MKRISALIAGVLVSAVVMSGIVSAQSVYPAATVGTDISWPNCSASIPGDSSFGIVGVTGGLGFHPNNCLQSEAGKFSNYSLYVNTGYPGITYGRKYQSWPKSCSKNDDTCLAYNYGYNAGKYAVDYANQQLVNSLTWWLDVETANSWTKNNASNIASLQGEWDAIKVFALPSTVGFYSTTYQWNKITGGWKNGAPSWVASGKTTLDAAKPYCSGNDFSGGGTWLVQYVATLDRDYVC